MGGVLPPPVENSLILLLPGKIPPSRLPPNQIFVLSPPKINYPVLNKNFQVIAKKASFLAVVIAPAPFSF